MNDDSRVRMQAQMRHRIKALARTPYGFPAIVLLGLMVSLSPALSVLMDSAKASSWKKTPCRILFSEVSTNAMGAMCAPGGGDEVLSVGFEYVSFGRPRESRSIHALGSFGVTDLLAKFPAGYQTICFVNPLYHREALLLQYPPLREVLVNVVIEYDLRREYFSLLALSSLGCFVWIGQRVRIKRRKCR